MTDLTFAEDAVKRLNRDDLLRIEALAGGRGAVAYFASDQGLRAHGQTSLIASSKGGYGLVIAVDGKIPRNAEAQALLDAHNHAPREMPQARVYSTRS